jgi:hypothetical protein
MPEYGIRQEMNCLSATFKSALGVKSGRDGVSSLKRGCFPVIQWSRLKAAYHVYHLHPVVAMVLSGA